MKNKALSFLVLLSGFAGLVYQVLWMRQLGLLFGNTAHAAALTLAAFFGGLAAGSWFWGRRVASRPNPLRTYARLELGIAVTALLYFAVFRIFQAMYPVIFGCVASAPLLLAAKSLLALMLVFPPAFFMGGTIPAIGQAVIRDRTQFGSKAAQLYAVNTLGAAAGAFAAGFVLVRFLGFRLTCLSAVVISTLVAAIAFMLARTPEFETAAGMPDPATRDSAKTKARTAKKAPEPRVPTPIFVVYAACFLSGFGFLALEVLWTRLLSQIHTNSVYSFACVLTVVLLALAAGAGAASRLARSSLDPMRALAGLMLAGGLSVALSPLLFMSITDGFSTLETGRTLEEYALNLFATGAATIGLPAFCLGMVFPFLMKVAESTMSRPGLTLGRLSAINTTGAIAGSLLCGFLLIEALGSWRSMQLISALYLAGGLVLPVGFSASGIVMRSTGLVILLLLFTGLSPVRLPVTGIDRHQPQITLVEVWETGSGTVAVTADENDALAITLNSAYRLGSTSAAWREHYQGRIPLLAYPHTRSIFFLGVGTGISAGGALDPGFRQVERVVACELVPGVVTAAKKYMTGTLGGGTSPLDYTCGLFTDPRVTILPEDGRNHLLASRETFDMINADLFLPYSSGAGNLYSREHFEQAKTRLNPDGIYVQWLPMYQLTETEFGSIARTMLDVFDQVTVWRNNFVPAQEVVALVGHRNAAPLPAAAVESIARRRAEVDGRDLQTMETIDFTYDESNALFFYCGNLTAARAMFLKYPPITDDRPVIEFTSPLSLRMQVDGLSPTIVGPRYEAFIDRILANCPPESDPMLSRHSRADRRLVLAGTEFHRCCLAKAMQDMGKAQKAWARFVEEWTDEAPAARETPASGDRPGPAG